MTPPRILEVTATWLIEKFYRSTDSVPNESSDPEATASSRDTGSVGSSVPSAESDGTAVRVTMGGRTHVLDCTRAEELRAELEDALDEQLEFVHTTGEHRRNGEYVVSRRGADSAGHRKVFPSFDHLARLYGRLPDSFTAEDLTRSGLTAGRRHMVLWHFVEHPDFDCKLTSRQPLTVVKQDGSALPAGSASGSGQTQADQGSVGQHNAGQGSVGQHNAGQGSVDQRSADQKGAMQGWSD